MQRVMVTYETQAPDGMTIEQIDEWVRYVLTERGEITPDNPRNGCGAEPDEVSIYVRVLGDNE